MNSTFTSDFFRNNRQQLLKQLDRTMPIILTANARLQQAMTEGYAFHQDRNFWYMTGVNEPEAVLVMDEGDEYLILRDRGNTQTIFDGGYDPEMLATTSGITTILSETEGWERLATRLKRVKSIATLEANPTYIDVFGLYSNPARAELIKRAKQHNAKLEISDLRSQFMNMRMVKQPVEVAMIQSAIDGTNGALEDALTASKRSEYRYEYEIEAEIAYGMRRRGASGHSFPPIVAGGIRGCTLHYIENQAKLDRSELIVIDVGAEQGMYAADISRTIALEQPTQRQEDVYSAVLGAVNYAKSILKPGVIIRDYEKQVETYIGKQLKQLGVIKHLDSATIRQYFPHATSHFLGLDVHDAGDYDQPLQPGVVMTVEPGIYIPEEAIGVRIEDDVVITKDGNTTLSDSLPYGVWPS